MFALTITTKSNAKMGNALKFGKSLKHLKGLKNIKKMMSALQNEMIAATIIDEIGSKSHGDTWDHGYFDHKFQLIGANMKAVDTDINAISTYIEQQDKRIEHNGMHTIIIAVVAFSNIVLLIFIVAFLTRRTQGSHVQKRMNGLLSAIRSMRDDTRQRLRLVKTRDEIHQLDDEHQEMQRGRNAIVDMDDH